MVTADIAGQAESEADFRLIGGRYCLDLIATLGKRHAAVIERIPDDATLLAWFVAAGVLPLAASAVPVEAGQLAAVRELREVTNRLVRARMTGAALDAADVGALNDIACRADLAPQLTVAGDGELSWGGRHPVDAAMATIARDAVRLLSGPRTERIRECARPDCSLLFFDESQPGRRRWCSMDRCGNLTKIAGYRQRTRS
ncbi:MAG TPA: ABATE domain-containing protein [Pseudonocardiaceae bacterium]|jgi:predicted RNA-binding Zn ribbon-like protein|nr:ABATE domain-containing protein [Pseudonocardiaceae bacterium]